MTLRRGHYVVGLGIIVAACLLARAWCFELSIGDDDQRWIVSARELHGERTSQMPAVYYGRILWRTVLSAWGHVFGSNLESSAGLMFMLAGISIVLIAEAARAAFRAETHAHLAALLAAAVYGLHPISIFYDCITLPDGLAVAVLAAAVLLVLRVVNSAPPRGAADPASRTDARLAPAQVFALLFAGVLAGAAFSIKEYFVFLILPLMWSARSRGVRSIAALTVGCAAGLAIDFALHWWDNGDWLGHFRSFTAYAGYGTTEGYSGARHVIGQLARRIEIPEMLFVSCAGIGGWIIIGAAIWMIAQRRRSPGIRLVLWVTVLFLLFLCVIPLKLRPLTLVQIQARYLLCVLPFLAIGAGGFLATGWECLRSTSLRIPAIAVFIVTLVCNIPAADHMPQIYHRREMAAIAQCCNSAASETGLIVPFGLDPVAVPDRLSRSTKLIVPKRISLAGAKELVLAQPRAGIYVSDELIQRTRFAVDPLLSNDMLARDGDTSEFRAWLQSQGYNPTSVDVPDSSLRRWTKRLGVSLRGMPTGTLFTR